MDSTKTLGELIVGDVVTARGKIVFDSPLTVARVLHFPKYGKTTVHFSGGGLIPAQPSTTAVTVAP